MPACGYLSVRGGLAVEDDMGLPSLAVEHLYIMPAQPPAERLRRRLLRREAGGIMGRGIGAVVAVLSLSLGKQPRYQARLAPKCLPDSVYLDDIYAKGGYYEHPFA